MNEELSKEQRLAISAVKRSIDRAIKSGIVLVMQDGSLQFHFLSDWNNMEEFDCGFSGMKMKDGCYKESIDSHHGIEH